MSSTEKVVVHWYRHGLRIQDCETIHEALKDPCTFYPIYIFGKSTSGMHNCGVNRCKFLVESIEDLDRSYRKLGSRLYTFTGKPLDVLRKILKDWKVTHLSFDQDPESVWQERDNEVKRFCEETNVTWIEKVSHTLWDPRLIIEKNGGTPPVTYQVFLALGELVGIPDRPCGKPDFTKVKLPMLESKTYDVPSFKTVVEMFNLGSGEIGKKYQGGETASLELLNLRLQLEEKTFAKNEFMPNQTVPDLMGKPMSLSPYLRFGCLSIHRMFWMIRDTYCKVNSAEVAPTYLTSQLIWREFFYTMSATNPFYNRMKGNPICLQIDWYDDEESYQKWVQGKTGFPWIDAIMVQLQKEGWVHQVCRHAVSSFLTRGDLWISWEKGFDTFEKNLLDADWSVCAGNWMWLSSSAFEKFLQCPNCFCPVRYGRRMDPSGEYIKTFLPVLKDMPLKYLFEPWKAPEKVQEEAKCILGKDYPKPIVKHSEVSKRNKKHMNDVMQVFKDIVISHCAPSSEQEVYDLTWLPDIDQETPIKCTADEFCTKV